MWHYKKSHLRRSRLDNHNHVSPLNTTDYWNYIIAYQQNVCSCGTDFLQPFIVRFTSWSEIWNTAAIFDRNKITTNIKYNIVTRLRGHRWCRYYNIIMWPTTEVFRPIGLTRHDVIWPWWPQCAENGIYDWSWSYAGSIEFIVVIRPQHDVVSWVDYKRGCYYNIIII